MLFSFNFEMLGFTAYLPTFVNNGLLLPEIGERWEFGDAIVFGQSFIVDFDKVHTEGVGVVVDLLQLLQHAIARGAAASI